MPLDVFEDNAAAGEKLNMLQERIDKALGEGRFAGRALKLRAQSEPVRGRLIDLEGHPLSNVTVTVEALQQPDISRLLEGFEKSWKREVSEALNVTSFGAGGLARSELQKLIPSVTTGKNGEFELHGFGDDQLVTLVFNGDDVEARPLHVLSREMKKVSLPHFSENAGGAKDVYVGRNFTYAVGPSVPVEGIIRDFDTGKPVANVLVYVERLFEEDNGGFGQMRLDACHMRAVSDQQGRFRITGMPPGKGHVLEAIPPMSAPYFMASQHVKLESRDGDAKRIEFRLKRGIWVEGRVTDKQSGDPISATVDYLALKKNPHSLEKQGLDQTFVQHEPRYQTDSDGNYRVLGLPGPGVLFVTSSVPGYPLASGAEKVDGYDEPAGVIPTTPFPVRVTHSNLLKQIEPPTDAHTFTSHLVLDAGVSIPGRAIGPHGKPVSDLFVLGQTRRDRNWRPRPQDNVPLSDEFAISGYDGKGPRQLFFKNKNETLVGQFRQEGDAPEEIVVTLKPAVRVKGRLMDKRTDLPASRFFLLCEGCFINKNHPPVDFSIHWCHTDDEGHFEIKGLMAGFKYKMNALDESNINNNRNHFTIDLSTAKPGETVDLGKVNGPKD